MWSPLLRGMIGRMSAALPGDAEAVGAGKRARERGRLAEWVGFPRAEVPEERNAGEHLFLWPWRLQVLRLKLEAEEPGFPWSEGFEGT